MNTKCRYFIAKRKDKKIICGLKLEPMEACACSPKCNDYVFVKCSRTLNWGKK